MERSILEITTISPISIQWLDYRLIKNLFRYPKLKNKYSHLFHPKSKSLQAYNIMQQLKKVKDDLEQRFDKAVAQLSKYIGLIKYNDLNLMVIEDRPSIQVSMSSDHHYHENILHFEWASCWNMEANQVHTPATSIFSIIKHSQDYEHTIWKY